VCLVALLAIAHSLMTSYPTLESLVDGLRRMAGLN